MGLAKRFAPFAALGGCALAVVIGASGSTSKATVSTAKNAALGTIVVGSTGRTLYHYLDDHGKKIDCTGACATQWPPVLVAKSAKPVAGAGIKAGEARNDHAAGRHRSGDLQRLPALPVRRRHEEWAGRTARASRAAGTCSLPRARSSSSTLRPQRAARHPEPARAARPRAAPRARQARARAAPPAEATPTIEASSSTSRSCR